MKALLGSLLLLLLLLAACTRSNSSASTGPVGSAAAAAPAHAEWVSYQDPAEQAFTMSVPQGWGVKGGLYRLGYSDYRAMVEITSPDGKSRIRYGDVGIPPYSAPDRGHAEGVSYVLEAQAQMTAARYRTGDEYAPMYAKARLQSVCQKAEVLQSNAAPFKAASFPQSDVTRESEGQMTIKCTTSGGVLTAFVYAKTQLHGNGAIWTVAPAVSFLCPPEQEASTGEVAGRFAQSFQVNQSWIQHQLDEDRQGQEFAQALARGKMQALAQQVQEFHARMQAMSNQVAGFEKRMDAQAMQVQGFTDVLNGITRTVDPLTGQERQVWTGQSNQYWADGLGHTVSSPTQPGPNYHPLTTISH